MAANYLHGVETIDIDVEGQTVRIVRSGVIALVGIAPIGEKNSLKLCYSPTDDAQFGKPVPGFNIPKTLQIIRAIAGNCPVLVVNVFDSATHTTQVTTESQTVVLGALKLAFAPIGTVTIFESDGTTDAGLVKDVDYTLDAYGNFKSLTSDIANGTVYKFSYKKLNGAAVTDAAIIGTFDSGTDVKTGTQLFDNAFNTFGFNPKILISPNYVTLATVAAELATKAIKYRAIVLQDAPYGTTLAGVIAGRGLAGTINFNTADPRRYLLYPFIKSFDEAAGTPVDYPYSAFMAAVIVKNDYENGYWSSPSNKVIPNATGTEKIIGWNISDAGSDANTLNSLGVTTAVSGFATGIRTWGNRSAAYPTSTSVKNFIALQRIDDILTESLEQGTLEDLDKPITQSFIDGLRQKGNALMAKLIQDGAILPGSQIKYNAADNSAPELAAGHIVFERIYMGPVPAERITFKNYIQISLLNQFA